jgi:biotin carboxyl carrier protein
MEVKSPMPGKVVKVLVAPGESVALGQPILLFEAMKMQNELRSPQDGVVAEIAVKAGQAVEARERLYVLSPPRS